MRSILTITAFYVTILCVCAFGAEVPCKMDPIISCLSQNFSVVYRRDNQLFWDILHKSEPFIPKNKNITVAFFRLANVSQNNAEFSEYYSEIIEGVIEREPGSFFEIMASLDQKSIDNVIRYLKEPTFISKSDLNRIMNRYSNNKKYRKVVNSYFMR